MILLPSRLYSTCTSFIASSTARRSFSVRTPKRPVYGYRPVATTSPQDIRSARSLSVSTIAIRFGSSFLDIPAMLLPSRNTVPPKSANCPAMLFKTVDLPAPFGPISVRISPFLRPISISSISGAPL